MLHAAGGYMGERARKATTAASSSRGKRKVDVYNAQQYSGGKREQQLGTIDKATKKKTKRKKEEEEEQPKKIYSCLEEYYTVYIYSIFIYISTVWRSSMRARHCLLYSLYTLYIYQQELLHRPAKAQIT
jgi:hypothetical protein